jgi:hypothetical protein
MPNQKTPLRSSLLFSAGVLILAASSCGGSGPGGACTALYAYGLSVTVRDDATSAPICDATVTAVDGTHSEQLEKSPGGGTDCGYFGAGERAGNYTITAVKSGYMNATQSNVVVTADQCHVKGVAVTLRMKP